MRNPQGMVANRWGRLLGAGAMLSVVLSGCGGDGAAPTGASQASIDAAGGRPLPTLEIPTQPVATPVPRARITEGVPELAPADSPPPLAESRTAVAPSIPEIREGIADRIDSARQSARDLRDRTEADAEALRRKADTTIDRTGKKVQSAADDLGRKVDGAIGEAERRVDQIHKKASDIQQKATDIQKKADDVREGVEQTGKALRDLIGGDRSKPRN